MGWDPAAVEEQGDVLPIEKSQTEWSEYLDDLGEPGNCCGGLGADASDGGMLTAVHISDSVCSVDIFFMGLRVDVQLHCSGPNNNYCVIWSTAVQLSLWGYFVPKTLKTTRVTCLFGKIMWLWLCTFVEPVANLYDTVVVQRLN